MLCYCKKCGRIVQKTSKELNDSCDYCNNYLLQIPLEYTIDNLGTCIKKELKDQFINDYIKSSPEFDQYLFEHREEDMFNKRMSDRAKLAHGASVLKEKSRLPKCPTCGSTNVQKISGTKRWLTTGLFGLASSDIGKTMVCKNCGYKW